MAASKKKPWRTIAPVPIMGRFTVEQLDAAVLAVKARREQKAVARASREETAPSRKKKPWRTVIRSEETGRFTREQIEKAVLTVMAKRERKGAEKAKPGGASRRSQEPLDRTEEEEEVEMASKKPWRTLAPVPVMGRFTVEQIDAAILAVEARREAREARKRARELRRSGERTSSEPQPRPARQRARPAA
jgi:hypothetical protein